MDSKEVARDKLLAAAANYLSWDVNPSDKGHSVDTSLELAQERLDNTVKVYSNFLEYPDQEEEG